MCPIKKQSNDYEVVSTPFTCTRGMRPVGTARTRVWRGGGGRGAARRECAVHAAPIDCAILLYIASSIMYSMQL